ncbi:hypothetical protein ACTFIR_009300 [Dictyostelium discoideum]
MHTIIAKNEMNVPSLYYSYMFFGKVNQCIIGSFYDIGKWIYGDQFEKKIKSATFLKNLQYLVWYKMSMTSNNHHQVYFSLSNLYSILNEHDKDMMINLESSLKINENNENEENEESLPQKLFKLDDIESGDNFKYSKILIGGICYYILNIKEGDIFKEDHFGLGKKILLLELKQLESGKKYLCFRKQSYQTNTFKELKFNCRTINEKINGEIILEPLFVFEDSNVTFHFYEYKSSFENTKSIESYSKDNSTDYNGIVIIRSLLYYIQYYLSNYKNDSDHDDDNNISLKLVLVNMKDNESLIYFDIQYLIYRLYGVDISLTNEWSKINESLINGTPSLITNFIQTNKNKILNDSICLEILSNELMVDFKPIEIEIQREINHVTSVVSVVNSSKKKFVRKAIGSIIDLKIIGKNYGGIDLSNPLSLETYNLIGDSVFRNVSFFENKKKYEILNTNVNFQKEIEFVKNYSKFLNFDISNRIPREYNILKSIKG